MIEVKVLSEFFKLYPQAGEMIVERVVEKAVAEVLERDREAILFALKSEVRRCVREEHIRDGKLIGSLIGDAIGDKWDIEKNFIRRMIGGLHGRVKKLEGDEPYEDPY